MAKIQKSFPTKYTKQEAKLKISENILTNPGVSALICNYVWEEYTLKVKSKLGSGTINVFDYKVDIDILLTIFGGATQQLLESTLDKEFKQLNP